MTENLYTPNCIRTISGRYVNLLEPTPDMIDIYDIAHGLARQYRFGGHSKLPFSVLQHSICVSTACQSKLAGLLHDAAEAYIGDIPTPLKKLLPQYQEIEDRLMKVISAKYGFPYPVPEDVKITDKKELESEWEWLVLKNYGTPINEALIISVFLKRFHRLTSELEA